MLKTLYEIEQYCGKIEAARPLSELRRSFGKRTVQKALNEGTIRKTQLRFSGKEPHCWLTDKGRTRIIT